MSPELLAATQGANQIQAPASNLGASQGPELAALYQSSFQLPQSQGAVSAQANVAAEQVAAAKKAAAEAEQRQKDLSDPSKYRQVQNKNGGYDFYDPNGNQVDIATLSAKTGTKPADWLKDSQDPTDVQYKNDYSNLQKFMDAVTSKDKKTVDAFTSTDSNLKKYTQSKGGLHNLMQDFYNSYQRYYVPRSQDPQAWGRIPGSPLVPTSQGSSSTDLQGLISQLSGQ